MNNSKENIATYILFGDEAISIYKISIKHLLKAEDVIYKVGKYFTVKDFFEEKDKWKSYIEIDYSDYTAIKKHLKKKPEFSKEEKKRFSFFSLFE